MAGPVRIDDYSAPVRRPPDQATSATLTHTSEGATVTGVPSSSARSYPKPDAATERASRPRTASTRAHIHRRAVADSDARRATSTWPDPRESTERDVRGYPQP